jgi:K+-sensing histidine kinase KdpD
LGEDTVNTDHDTKPRNRDRTAAAALALVGTTATLVAVALAASGTVRIATVGVLGLLVMVVAVVTSAVERARVTRQVASLEEALETESENVHRLSRLLARFSDELRAPLTAVYGLSRHLEDVGITDVAEAEVLIGMISRDATEIARTVENTAAAAQIDAGTYRPRSTVVELDQHVARIVGAIGPTPLEISIDARATTVWSDPAAVRLMLLNVLHTAANGQAATARIDVEERNGLGILSITDDRQRGHVPNPTAGDLLGTGDTLSRSIVSALAENQGGTMSSARTLGWSNTVIRLPIATPAQLSAANGTTSTSRTTRIS